MKHFLQTKHKDDSIALILNGNLVSSLKWPNVMVISLCHRNNIGRNLTACIKLFMNIKVRLEICYVFFKLFERCRSQKYLVCFILVKSVQYKKLINW